MYQLTKVKDNTYTVTINGTDNGLYLFGKRSAVLIDSGREPQDEFISFLREEGIKPVAVINTHLHIDHIGCNKLLQQEFGCEIFASADEIDHELDADYGGGEGITAGPNEGILDICGQSFEIISTPGHSEGHQAVVTPDGVCFLGDAVVEEEVLASSKMIYHLDMQEALASMNKIKSMDFSHFVLSHRGIKTQQEIMRTVEANLKREEEFRSLIRKLDSKRMSEEKLALLFMREIGISEEKQDIAWVWETAMARVIEYRRLK